MTTRRQTYCFRGLVLVLLLGVRGETPGLAHHTVFFPGFAGNELAQIELHAIEEGYGSTLPESGIPRVVTDEAVATAIFQQITDQTAQFGLPKLNLSRAKTTAIIRP